MKATAKKSAPAPATRRLKPSERNKRCQLCEYREPATGTIANSRVGPGCLGIIERIAAHAGMALPVPEFHPFKPTKA